MKKDKIKALLSLKGLNMTNLANFMGKSKQQISNKNKSDVWSSDDLIKIAIMSNSRLAFIDNETNKELVSFDENDIKKEN